MGLSEPRKRIKIAHDPRNLAWSQSDSSYGQRLMQQQGWQTGQSLGARTGKYNTAADDAARLAASRVGVLYKDDMLGVGAQLKSKDVQHQRTGLDAFQGLLGRLNSKTEAEVQEVEKKIEDKKLAMFTQGRWGGMVFVPGGVLVQGDEFKRKDLREQKMKKDEELKAEAIEDVESPPVEEADNDDDEAAIRKAEKRKRKEERRMRREQRKARKAAKASARTSTATTDNSSDGENDDDDNKTVQTKHTTGAVAPDEPVSSSDEENSKGTEPPSLDDSTPKPKPKLKQPQPSATATTATTTGATAKEPPSKQVMRNGRHLLRGKNIQAKRMAFSDARGLDEIFMKKP